MIQRKSHEQKQRDGKIFNFAPMMKKRRRQRSNSRTEETAQRVTGSREGIEPAAASEFQVSVHLYSVCQLSD